MIGNMCANYKSDVSQDEPFHIGQTQQYCRGKFKEWDPKITTFPGLYFFGAIAGSSWHALQSSLSRSPSTEVHSIHLYQKERTAITCLDALTAA